MKDDLNPQGQWVPNGDKEDAGNGDNRRRGGGGWGERKGYEPIPDREQHTYHNDVDRSVTGAIDYGGGGGVLAVGGDAAYRDEIAAAAALALTPTATIADEAQQQQQQPHARSGPVAPAMKPNPLRVARSAAGDGQSGS